MHAERHTWLELVIAACEGAADRLDPDDPHMHPLLVDIKRLQARCQAELDQEQAPS